MARRVAILTGANRGLGRRTAEILVEKYSAGFHFVFTQRSENNTELIEALKKINPEASFSVQQLEITDKNSRIAFLNWLSATHKTADVIFNNAGVYDKNSDNGQRPNRKTAQFTLDVNFRSTVEFTEEIFPLLTADAKIIEMSSMLGQIANQPEGARKFLQDETLTKDRLFQLSDDYINNAEDLTKDLIFSNFCYHFSKSLLTAYIRFVASSYIKPDQSVFAVHPGWVKTDMGTDKAPLTVDQSCPYLAAIVAEFPFGRHELSGRLIFENKSVNY